jgi:hypothetical protein
MVATILTLLLALAPSRVPSRSMTCPSAKTSHDAPSFGCARRSASVLIWSRDWRILGVDAGA